MITFIENERITERLIPIDEPVRRVVETGLFGLGKVEIYDCKESLLGITDIQGWLSTNGTNQEELLKSARNLYHRKIKEQLQELKSKYDREKGKGLWGALKNALGLVDVSCLLLIKQHISDLEKIDLTQDKTGSFHALTIEYYLLTNYIIYREQYLCDYPIAPLIPGTTRFSSPPDQNLFFYVSGYWSDWKAAVREAYCTGYKLGYALENIYVFNYASNTPLQLGQVMGHDARTVGDFRLIIELEKMIEMENNLGGNKKEKIEKLKAELQKLVAKTKLLAFAREDNLKSVMEEDAARLGEQLKSIKRTRVDMATDEIEKNRKINLVAQSQGGGVAGGFLLQNNKNTGIPYLDDEIKDFLDKYALLIPAHGGAYLAQAGSLARKFNNLILYLFLLVKEGRDTVCRKITHQLAIDSDYTQENYAQLYQKSDKAYIYSQETSKRLMQYPGIEVYAANDDVTTSIPLAPLPSTRVIKMVNGRHGDIIAGSGEDAGNKANKYLYDFFKGNPLPPNYESDRLIYSGYLKKGLPDLNFGTLVAGGWDSGFWRKLVIKIGRKFVPTFFGKAGVIDYPVQASVMNDLKRDFKQSVNYWPELNFEVFHR